MKEFAEMQITDEMLKKSSHVFKINPPDTKEAYYYRMIFSELFPSDQAASTVDFGPSIACSSPVAFKWNQEFKNMDDPSGRAVNIHREAIKK